jgi:hypothetical protein
MSFFGLSRLFRSAVGDGSALSTSSTPSVKQEILEVPDIFSSLKASDEFSDRTLAMLLARALPICHIKSPEVIIMGAQSSGKTKIIISMVFYYLLTTEGFSEDMGNVLLQIFRTGGSMVTMRPIHVYLSNDSPVESTTCELKIRLHGESADFHTEPELFAAILQEVVGTTALHLEPLQIYINSAQLPNISFTDLPGLTTSDKVFIDNPLHTVKSVVRGLAAQDNNIIVIVETASNAFDLETSHIVPLIK